ncbi:MAG: ADP-ribosylglycohydrolase family protein [Ktedonobacteraceae bacterium]|nr:ADP-ribosylglycohydrolase family protein [Ktedonobacteraceae bacterium]
MLTVFEEAIRQTLRVLGDCDTNCAMVGGIVALSSGISGIPAHWLTAREPLPDWPFQERLA